MEQKISRIQQMIIDIIASQIPLNNLSDNNPLDTELTTDVIDSITFVQIVVAIETEFDIEFENEKLLLAEFPTIRSIFEYVCLKIHEKNQI